MRGRTIALVALVAVVALTLAVAGCGEDARAPKDDSGVPRAGESTKPEGAGDTSNVPHVSDVSPEVFSKVVDDLGSAGFETSEETELRMSYGETTETVAVFGPIEDTRSGKVYDSLVLEYERGGWVVKDAAGR